MIRKFESKMDFQKINDQLSEYLRLQWMLNAKY